MQYDIFDSEVMREINDLRDAKDAQGLARMYREHTSDDVRLAIKSAVAIALDRTLLEANAFLRCES